MKLKKSLYGLNQLPRMWYQKFDMHIQQFWFVRRHGHHSMYEKNVSDHFVYLVLYVDNMLFVGNNMDIIKEVKLQLSSKFDMKDLRASYFILGMEINIDRLDKRIQLNQTKYVETTLKFFNVHECKPIKVLISMGVKLYVEQCSKTQEEIEYMSHLSYASFVGILMYSMVCT